MSVLPDENSIASNYTGYLQRIEKLETRALPRVSGKGG
jgi:hypothetical protein